jgi:hypothetical protein
VKISISTNFPEVQRKLDRLARDVSNTVTTRAMNATIAQAKTSMSKEIRTEFNVSAAFVRDRLKIKRAFFRGGALSLVAELSAPEGQKGDRGINLIRFGAKKNNKGVSVKIKKVGARKMVGGAFIGNKGRTVFQRIPGSIMRSRAQSLGKQHRERIKPLSTINVPGMFNTRRINAAVVAAMEARFPAIFEREMAWALQRFGR